MNKIQLSMVESFTPEEKECLLTNLIELEVALKLYKKALTVDDHVNILE